MKRFSFPLDRVLDLRRYELEVAEARLHTIQSQQEQARRRAGSLEQRFAEVSEQSLRVQVTSGAELRAVEAYLGRLHAGRKLQVQEEQRWEAERHKQVTWALDVRRKVRLIERLRQKRERQHLEAAGRELESQAAEFYLAKWVRERLSET